MSNISSNIGVGSGIPEVAEIPATGSDGDLIRFRGILFRWDKDAGAWRPLPTRGWQELEGWQTGDLRHWSIDYQDSGVSYSISKGSYLEVTLDSATSNKGMNFRLADGDIHTQKAVEIRVQVQKKSPNPGSGGSVVRWFYDRPNTGTSLQYGQLDNSSSGDFVEARLDDDSGNLDADLSQSFTWPQDADTYFHMGVSHRAETEELTGWVEAYDSSSLYADAEGTATPVPDVADFELALGFQTDADIQQKFRVYSISMRAIG